MDALNRLKDGDCNINRFHVIFTFENNKANGTNLMIKQMIDAQHTLFQIAGETVSHNHTVLPTQR